MIYNVIYNGIISPNLHDVLSVGAAENNMIDRGYDLFKTLQLAGMTLNHNWKSSDPNVASRYGVLGSGKEEHFVAVASANIDADLSSCLAYAYMFQSREKER